MNRAMIIAAALALSMTSGAAKAIDKSEADFAEMSVGVFFLTTMCPDYVPIVEVIKYLGKRSMGEEKTHKITLAVSAEIMKELKAGGMKIDDSKAGVAKPSDLDPEITKIVEKSYSGLMETWHDQDKNKKICRDLGDHMVENGFAEKVK